MNINNRFSLKITSFHGRVAPEEAHLVGYGAIISTFDLEVPIPQRLSLISDKKDNIKMIIGKYLHQDITPTIIFTNNSYLP